MADLKKAREEINAADKEMAKIFIKRMDAVREVAAYKKECGVPVEDKTREEELIQRNSELFENDEYRSYYVNFLHYVMELSKSFQHRLLDGLRVAYSGVEGAFANIAAMRIFPDCSAISYPDFKSAYKATVDGSCDSAVLPIENSYNGDVGQVMDLAFFGELYINGIYDIEIIQNLLGTDKATIESIKEVISHPQALGQCAEFISSHGYKQTSAVNTAVAAKMVAESGRTDIAAIGSVEAGEKYGLKKIEGHINSASGNTTRFAVFSRTPKANAAADNCFILLFTVNNEAGSLGRAVSVIGSHGFNLRALKSRPTKELSWSYYFYAEGEGNIHSEKGKEMLCELQKCCNNVKIIGSFEKEIVL